MKKILGLFIMCFAAVVCSAQIQVASTGNVTIGDTLSANNKLFVNAIGSYENGIYSLAQSTITNSVAISGEVAGSVGNQIAIFGRATSVVSGTGRSYGVYGIAGNRSPGYNYGVYGALSGGKNGAGIFGVAATTSIPQINGKYAGYFHGDTYVTGTLTAGVVTTLSDARYKSNIQQINATALAKIAALNPVQYTMLSGEAIALANTEPTDTTSTMTMTTSEEEDLAKANQIHYGLLAQEVKELYPELVHEDAAGVMSINYTELIPLLIQAVQDLSEQVEALSNNYSVLSQQ